MLAGWCLLVPFTIIVIHSNRLKRTLEIQVMYYSSTVVPCVYNCIHIYIYGIMYLILECWQRWVNKKSHCLPLLSTHVYSSPLQHIGLDCNNVILHSGLVCCLWNNNQIHHNFGYRFTQIANIFYVLILMLLMLLWIKIQFPSVICSIQNPASLQASMYRISVVFT